MPHALIYPFRIFKLFQTKCGVCMYVQYVTCFRLVYGQTHEEVGDVCAGVIIKVPEVPQLDVESSPRVHRPHGRLTRRGEGGYVSLREREGRVRIILFEFYLNIIQLRNDVCRRVFDWQLLNG